MRASPLISTPRISLHAHLIALQEERDKFMEERDRRYTEVKNAEEKALKIKEEADKVALDLARQIQTYKDEQHNNLAEQINRERGHYATKEDLVSLAEKMEVTVKPLVAFVAGSRGGSAVWGQLAIGFGLLLSAIALFIKL
jgi:hypothetical protein